MNVLPLIHSILEVEAAIKIVDSGLKTPGPSLTA
jgi:hypothetical protein